MSVVKKKRKATVGPYGDYAKNSDSACINNRSSLVITYISSMFYLCYLFLYFFSLLALGSQNQRKMDGLWYVTYSWGCGVILISHDWILYPVSNFWGGGEIAPNFAKNLMVPSFVTLS